MIQSPKPVKPVLHLPQLEANRFNQLQTRHWRPGDHFNQAGDILGVQEEFCKFIPCTSNHWIRRILIYSNLPYLEQTDINVQQLFSLQIRHEIRTYQAPRKVPRKLSYPLKPSRFKKNQVSHLEPKSHKRLQRLVVAVEPEKLLEQTEREPEDTAELEPADVESDDHAEPEQVGPAACESADPAAPEPEDHAESADPAELQPSSNQPVNRVTELTHRVDSAGELASWRAVGGRTVAGHGGSGKRWLETAASGRDARWLRRTATARAFRARAEAKLREALAASSGLRLRRGWCLRLRLDERNTMVVLHARNSQWLGSYGVANGGVELNVITAHGCSGDEFRRPTH
ncbi:hypothetical protein IGI04_035851 [Brassica rapa subsp. trilocularis]|uniref:Uncharacterized protein n=1 Tax=Brassica rapa subsp. trilocularis TaxID=1813537 RepID=A0ABQ7LGK5_BRACM|nr:hypothetical protein IGI04_035851 [Brassica rapa subsp. trilocularis]